MFKPRNICTKLILVLAFLNFGLKSLAQGLSIEEIRAIDSVMLPYITQINKGRAQEQQRQRQRQQLTPIDFEKAIIELGKRKIEWRSWEPAYSLGSYICDCKNSNKPLGFELNDKIIEDVIFQYTNPYGESEIEKQRNAELVLSSLACIGSERTIQIVFEAIKKFNDDAAWRAFSIINSDKVLPIVNLYLDFNNQTYVFYALNALRQKGYDTDLSILEKLLTSSDRAVMNKGIEIAKEMGTRESTDLLKQYKNNLISTTKDSVRLNKIIFLLETRLNDKIWNPYQLDTSEYSKIQKLIGLSVRYSGFRFSEEFNAVFNKLGHKCLPVLRANLRDYSHGDGYRTVFYNTIYYLSLMERIGKPSIPYLIDALNDDMNHVRELAYEMLVKITNQKFKNDYQLWKDWYKSQK